MSRLKVIRLLVADDKPSDLQKHIANWRSCEPDDAIFSVCPKIFGTIPTSPFVYWVDASIIGKLAALKSIEPEICTIRVGLQTGHDFRFLRLWWEVAPEKIVSVVVGENAVAEQVRAAYLGAADAKQCWCYYSKTEKAGLFLSNMHLVVKWGGNGAEIKAYHAGNGHTPSKYVMSENFYFLPGIGYMLRSSRLMPYAVPFGVIPTAGRSQIFPKSGHEQWLLAIVSSNVASAVARFRGENFSQPKFQNSLVASVPYVNFEVGILDEVTSAIKNASVRASDALACDETSIRFVGMPRGRSQDHKRIDRRSLLGRENEVRMARHFGLSSSELDLLERDLQESIGIPKWVAGEKNDVNEDVTHDLREDYEREISFAVGVTFGRWDVQCAVARIGKSSNPDLFEPMPRCPPGLLKGPDALPAKKKDIPDNYPVNVNWSGVASCDAYGLNEFYSSVIRVLDLIVVSGFDEFENVACNALQVSSLREYLENPRLFFAEHLRLYSGSRRQAPIYWPLSTVSGHFTLWIYYHRLTSQTLYTVVNDNLEPRLKVVERSIFELRAKANRDKKEERKFEQLENLETELKELRETILEIAKDYVPNHDDGVQITAAPLWQLFQHKPWQKVLKDTWKKLEKGEYDWAHLAMNYWPDRVREKCKTDKSLAIAHGLEDLYSESSGN